MLEPTPQRSFPHAAPSLQSRAPVGRAWAAGALLATLLGAASAVAQDEEAEADTPAWSGQAELSLVATGGNSEATTFGFAGSLERALGRGTFKIAVDALRAETGTTERRAVGTPDDFRRIDTDDSETTAENYRLKTRYEGEISERRSWFGELSWQRDEFAGFDSRLSAAGGITFLIADTETRRLSLEVGATWTREEDLAGGEEDFPGARFAADAFRTLTDTTDFLFALEIDQNLDETDDLRAQMTAALQVAISEILALKVSLDLRFDNLPASVAVPLEDAAGSLTGESVLVELDELDSILKAALVVKF
ncbi:MAG: DUF481 domain-containing protein [Acidobacteriota bacterium]